MSTIPIPLLNENPRRYTIPPHLGWFGWNGQPICRGCYLRLSADPMTWRVRLTRWTPDTGKRVLVSTIWTGCDPGAVFDARLPEPFVTAVEYADEDGAIDLQRAASALQARVVHQRMLDVLLVTGGSTEELHGGRL